MTAATTTTAGPTAAVLVDEVERHLRRRGAWSGAFDGDARAEARELVRAARVDLDAADLLDDEQLEAIRHLLLRRLDGVHLAHLTGWAVYRGMRLVCPPEAFVPRNAIGRVLEGVVAGVPRGGTVLELGTGTGAVAIAIARERPDVRVTAVELDARVAAAARQNVTHHGVAARVDVLVGDLYAPVSGTFDLVVANLPYVPTSVRERPLVSREALAEPELAIWRPGDGLDLVRAAIAGAPAHLAGGGRLVLEVGGAQVDHLTWLLAGAGRWWTDADGSPLGLVDVTRDALVA